MWSTVPTLSFVQGIAASISVSQYVTDANRAALVLSLNGVVLPAGVSYNKTTQSFDYDGVGAVGGADGLVLTATQG